MLGPTTTNINAASSVWTIDEQQLWLPLLTGSHIYRNAAFNFTDLPARLAKIVDGSLQAKQMNATMAELDNLTAVVAGINGPDGDYNTQVNRDGFLEYALSAVYGADYRPLQLPLSVAIRTVPRY